MGLCLPPRAAGRGPLATMGAWLHLIEPAIPCGQRGTRATALQTMRRSRQGSSNSQRRRAGSRPQGWQQPTGTPTSRTSSKPYRSSGTSNPGRQTSSRLSVASTSGSEPDASPRRSSSKFDAARPSLMCPYGLSSAGRLADRDALAADSVTPPETHQRRCRQTGTAVGSPANAANQPAPHRCHVEYPKC